MRTAGGKEGKGTGLAGGSGQSCKRPAVEGSTGPVGTRRKWAGLLRLALGGPTRQWAPRWSARWVRVEGGICALLGLRGLSRDGVGREGHVA